MANCVWNRLLTRVTNRYGEHVEQQRSFSKALVLSVRRTEIICRSTCRYGEHVEQQRCYFSSKALPSQAVCSSQALPSLAREFCCFSSTFFLLLVLASENQFYLSFDMPQTNMANCVWNRVLTRVANPRQQTQLEYT